MNGFDATPYAEQEAAAMGRRYQEQHQTGPTTYFADKPMLGKDALAAMRGMSHTEMDYDGNSSLTIRPSHAGPREFSPKTDVTYINGIKTKMDQQIETAQTIANITGNQIHVIHASTVGIAGDLLRCAEEKQGSSASMFEPEGALERSITQSLEVGRDVHIFAHSRGALITQRALEAIDADNKMRGMSPAERKAALSHVTVETLGGAATSFPDGVRTVNYANTHDAVSASFGMAHGSEHFQSNALILTAVSPGLGDGAELWQSAKELRLHPNGPVVQFDGKTQALPWQDLTVNHDVGLYLQHRVPFERAYAAYENGKVPVVDYASLVPDREMHSLQRGIERVRSETGVRLPDAAGLKDWHGKNQDGSIVHLDDPGTVAQHVGGGHFVRLDVDAHLGGTRPPEGQMITVGANPPTQQVQPQHQSLGR